MSAGHKSAEESAQETVAWLNDVMGLLKKGGVTQKQVADLAGLKGPSISQYLHAGRNTSYPIARVINSPETVARIVGAMDSVSLTASTALEGDSGRMLSERLRDLVDRYPPPNPILGMDGGPYVAGAENYLPNDWRTFNSRELIRGYLDAELDRQLEKHRGRGRRFTPIQICGAPGMGKTWALGHLAAKAADTHTVLWHMTKESGGLSDVPDLLGFVRAMRVRQRDRYEDLVRLLRRHDIGPTDDVVGSLEELPQIAANAEELEPALDALRDLLWARVDGLKRNPLTLDNPGYAAYMVITEEYSSRTLAEDLTLFTALDDACNALAGTATAGDRLYLMLIDSPDRNGDPSDFMTILRGIGNDQRRFYPLVDRFMIVVSKTMLGDGRTPVSESTFRNVLELEPWDATRVLELLRVLEGSGWLGLAVLDGRSEVELASDILEFTGGNRRATCMYLDHLHAIGTPLSPREYVGNEDRRGGGGTDRSPDPRFVLWLWNWEQFVISTVERYAQAHSADHDVIVAVLEWCADETVPLDSAQLDQARRFGLMGDPSSNPSLLHGVMRHRLGDAWRRHPSRVQAHHVR